jgi:hypothetical protein
MDKGLGCSHKIGHLIERGLAKSRIKRFVFDIEKQLKDNKYAKNKRMVCLIRNINCLGIGNICSKSLGKYKWLKRTIVVEKLSIFAR